MPKKLSVKKSIKKKNPKGRLRQFRIEASIDGRKFITIDSAASFEKAKQLATAHARRNLKETVRVVLA